MARPLDPTTPPPLDPETKARIRAEIVRKLAEGHVPLVPRDPLRSLGRSRAAIKLASAGGILAAGGVVVAVAVASSSPRRDDAPSGTPRAEAAEVSTTTRPRVRSETKMPAPPAPGSRQERPSQEPRTDGETSGSSDPSPGAEAEPSRRPRGPRRRAAPTPQRSTTDPDRGESKSLGASPSAAAEGGLSAELALLDRAREALASGDAAGALAATRTHGRRFPHGALAPERESLAIAALCALGRRDAARSRAQRFLEQHPTSPLAPAVRASCGGSAGE